MKKILITLFFAAITFIGLSQNNVAIHHVLKVQIQPGTSHIVVVDSVFTVGMDELVFSLNASLTPTFFSKNVKAEQLVADAEAKDIGMDRDDSGGNDSGLKLSKWKLILKKGTNSFVVHYEGEISVPFSESEENYQRGFAESPGIISETGIYLAGSTYWVPTVDEKLANARNAEYLFDHDRAGKNPGHCRTHVRE